MKKLLLIVAISSLIHASHGQSVINKNLYIANPVQINPAYLGSQGKLFLGLQSSLTANNDLGLPAYSSINVHGSIFENLGVGTNFLSESQGPFSMTAADIGSSYKVFLSDNQRLSFGLTFGFIRQTLDPSAFNTNGYVDQNDPYLSGDFYNQTSVKIGTGVLYQLGNLDLGIGAPFLSKGNTTLNKEANINAAYTWAFQGDRLKLNPSILYQIKAEDADLYDLNMRGIYMDKFWLMMGYRSNQSLNFAFGLSADMFDVGYNYNAATGDLKSINANNHELMVAFTIKRKSAGKLDKHSRANQTFKIVNKGEMDQKFTQLQQKYDEQAAIGSSNLEEEKEKRAELEAEIVTLRNELGIVKAIQENEESKVVKEELLSDKLAIESGNYVVVSTCKTLLCAEQIQVDLKIKGENNTDIVLNKQKEFYYIVTGRFSNKSEALESMERKRKSGFKDSWVLVYK